MSFAELQHQPSAVAALEAALAAERVPHAFIFCGPAGVGKALAARLLARTLLCDRQATARGKTQTVTACGSCRQCRLCDAGTHPDLNWFAKPADRADLPISLVTRRDDSPPGLTINESVLLKPMQAACRVTVIEDAEAMNAAAANAFLKTFEESPQGSYLVLLVTSLDRLLPTIRSRGQLVRFRALPHRFVAEVLARQTDLGPDDAAILARFSEGSIARGTALARSGFLALRRDVLEALPEAGRAEALALADAVMEWASRQADLQQTTGRKVEENELRRIHLKHALDLMGSLLRDVLVAATAGPDAHLLNADATPLVQRIAQRLAPDALEGGLRRMIQYQTYVDRNVHNALLIENACLDMADLLAPLRS